MKKVVTFLSASILLFSVAACNEAKKTSSVAPDSTTEKIEVPNAREARDAKEDATSETRRRQLNADIKAREQRNNALNQGSAENRADEDIASEVRSKLEANLPASALVVEAKGGDVTVTGSVPTKQQFNKIGNLVEEIKGVKNVNVRVVVGKAKAKNNS